MRGRWVVRGCRASGADREADEHEFGPWHGGGGRPRGGPPPPPPPGRDSPPPQGAPARGRGARDPRGPRPRRRRADLPLIGGLVVQKPGASPEPLIYRDEVATGLRAG